MRLFISGRKREGRITYEGSNLFFHVDEFSGGFYEVTILGDENGQDGTSDADSWAFYITQPTPDFGFRQVPAICLL